ncbi:MAG: hypothetical protein QG622_392 [Actinomycetota bacterium]|nr:hypothetical protein [Actinomycetota bacterium]
MTDGPWTCSTGGVPKGPDDDYLATLTPLRGINFGSSRRRKPAKQDEPALWFVTVTVSGERVPPDSVYEALQRLSLEQPFLVSAGYASTRAEVRYWDESMDIEGAVAQALRLWSEHQDSAQLPRWKVVGVEVVDKRTARRRWDDAPTMSIGVLGEIRRMENDEA